MTPLNLKSLHYILHDMLIRWWIEKFYQLSIHKHISIFVRVYYVCESVCKLLPLICSIEWLKSMAQFQLIHQSRRSLFLLLHSVKGEITLIRLTYQSFIKKLCRLFLFKPRSVCLYIIFTVFPASQPKVHPMFANEVRFEMMFVLEFEITNSTMKPALSVVFFVSEKSRLWLEALVANGALKGKLAAVVAVHVVVQ